MRVSGDAGEVRRGRAAGAAGRRRRGAGDGGAARAAGSTALPIAASAAPLLGVCLGMQLLFERSDEGDVDCLGLLAGSVVPIDWAERRAAHGLERRGRRGQALPAVCYFAHSYAVDCPDDDRSRRATPIDGREVPTVIAGGGVSAASSSTRRRARPPAAAMLERWLAA